MQNLSFKHVQTFINHPKFIILEKMVPPPKKFGKNKKGTIPPPEIIVRVRTPRGRETLGVVESRLGGSRMKVRCFDGKSRVCRIPGRLKRSLWVREGNYVLVEPWEFGGDDKGDVIYKYRPNQVDFLKKKGIIKEEEVSNEF